MPPLAMGGLTIYGGSTAQSLTTTAAKMTGWLANSSYDSRNVDGDTSVRPDFANNRLLLMAPGRYEVDFDIQAIIDSQSDITAQVYKNSLAVADLIGKGNVTTTNAYGFSFKGILNVTSADNPGTIGTFADTTATTNPPAQVTYASAPKVMVPVEIYLKAGGSISLTPVNAHFNAARIG